jgi:hypothetical protein
LVATLGIFVPAAFADCTPAGTNGNDTIVCSGSDDADGVNTRQGTLDTVNIISGTVLDTIVSRADQISVIVNGTGALDTTALGTNAINMPQGGVVIFQGTLKAGKIGIRVEGGSVDSTGDIEALDGIAIIIYGDGSVVSTGELVAGYNAIYVDGDGSIDNTGDITINSEGLKLGRYEYIDNTGLVLTGSGTINNVGDISVTYDDFGAGDSLPLAAGIILGGGGSITNVGDITVTYTGEDVEELFGLAPGVGIALMGGGSITNTGDIHAGLAGIAGLDLEGLGSILGGLLGGGSFTPSTSTDFTITNTGDIYSLLGMVVATDGDVSITNTGDISGIGGLGGTLSFLSFDLGAGYLVFTPATASITNTGNINNALVGYVVLASQSSIVNTGDIDAALMGMAVIGNATIKQTGDITVDGSLFDEAGFIAYCMDSMSYTEEDCQAMYDSLGGMLDMYIGEYTAGIAGIYGEQHVDFSGSISAPIAVALGDGNDSFYIRPLSNIQGIISMGEGDDIVQIGNYAVVTDTILGGEGGEVDGDLLIIGDGQVCAEDAAAVADAMAGLGGASADAGTLTYLGQTYTWAEFEQLAQGGFIAPCIGKINDGRINAYDLAAPDALYCTVDNGISVWGINLEGMGTFSFAVTKAELEAAFAVATSSGVNQLVASDGAGSELYAVSDGMTLTFVAPDLREPGKTYLYSFDRATCG